MVDRLVEAAAPVVEQQAQVPLPIDDREIDVTVPVKVVAGDGLGNRARVVGGRRTEVDLGGGDGGQREDGEKRPWSAHRSSRWIAGRAL
jgi:hypothetical protein